MDCSTPGLPVRHQLPEFTQTHVHWVSDAIQPSHPLSSPSPPAPNPSQHQGLFQWVNSLHEVANVLEFQLQHQSFQWIFRTDFLWDGLVGSPCHPRDSQESSPIPQFKSIDSSVLSFLYSPALTSIHVLFIMIMLNFTWSFATPSAVLGTPWGDTSQVRPVQSCIRNTCHVVHSSDAHKTSHPESQGLRAEMDIVNKFSR